MFPTREFATGSELFNVVKVSSPSRVRTRGRGNRYLVSGEHYVADWRPRNTALDARWGRRSGTCQK